MGLMSWWLGVKLNRIEGKLKRAHGLQRRTRTLLDQLADAKREGASPAEIASRKAKLESQREHLTRDINRLHTEAERIKGELMAMRAQERASA